MKATVSFKLYELLLPLAKEEKKARKIVESIEEIVESKFDAEKDRLSTKEDIANLRAEIKETKVDMIKWCVVLFAMLALMIIGLYFK